MKKLTIVPSTALVSVVLLIGSAVSASAALKQHLYCGVVQIQLPTILITPPPSATLSIRNTTSRTIAAGTIYTYVVNNHTNLFHSSSALAPGDHVALQVTYDASLPSSYNCDAWVPQMIATVPTATVTKKLTQ